MPEYEIRVLNDDRYSVAKTHERILMDDETAISVAMGLACGSPFEVWRELECIYGLASARPLSDRALSVIGR
jgi:hypothetical protein